LRDSIGNWAARIWQIAWPTALLANLVICYLALTWSISHYSYGAAAGLLAAGVCGFFLLGSIWALFPSGWARAFHALAEGMEPLGNHERVYLSLGLVFLVVIVLALIGFSMCPILASPVPIILLAFFGIVFLYALLTYLFRRMFVMAILVLVFLAVAAHIQPYHMRFANGLETYYSNDRILDLQKEAKIDFYRQTCFDDLFENYRTTVRAINKRTGSLKNIRNGLKSKELSAKEEKEFQEDQKKTCQELNE